MTLCFRTALVALALMAGVTAAAALPLDDNARSSADEFNNTQGNGKAFWEKQMKERE